MRFPQNIPARWLATDRRGRGGATRRVFRPGVEAVEGRQHPSAAVLLVAHAPLATAAPTANPVLGRYRAFVATITQGKDAGTTVEGPIVLGYSGRIQVIGYFFPRDGARDVVVGTLTGGGATFTVELPGGGSIQAGGSGQLQGVSGGLPGGLSLVGQGHFFGPGPGDQGTWETLAPSKVGGL
jgi:hypothetical protein